MNNFDKVLKGVNLYPSVDNKFVSIVLSVNMKKDYKEIFEIDCSFEEFIEDIKNDEFTRNIAFDILYEYFGFKKMPIITDSSFENWYFISLKDKVVNPYTISYVDKIGSMNTLSIMDDYVDLFNNRIEYKMA